MRRVNARQGPNEPVSSVPNSPSDSAATHPSSSDAAYTSRNDRAFPLLYTSRLLTSSISYLTHDFRFFHTSCPHTHTHHQHPFSSPRQAAVADGRSHQSVPLDAKSVRDLLGQRAALGRLLAFSRCRLKERESNEIKVLVPFL